MRRKVVLSSSQSGQIAVVILLLMAVLLVLGLSLATRTSEEVFLSQQSSESARVWNAAETAAEEKLSQLQAGNTQSFTKTYEKNNAEADVSVQPNNSLETTVDQMETVEVDLGNGGYNGTLRIWFGKGGDCSKYPDLLVSIYYRYSPTDIRVLHHPVAAKCNDTTAARTTNNFNMSLTHYIQGQGTSGFANLANIPIRNEVGRSDFKVRIKPLYNNAELRIDSQDMTLPPQQHTITSRARNLSGDEERAVQVTRSLPTAPSILDFALYSGGSITKP
jgi:hypothetical protein